MITTPVRAQLGIGNLALSLVLFGTALCGLSNAKADDDYWRCRHHRWHDGDNDRDDCRFAVTRIGGVMAMGITIIGDTVATTGTES